MAGSDQRSLTFVLFLFMKDNLLFKFHINQLIDYVEYLVILTNFSINGQLKRLVFHGKTMNEKRRNIAARVSYHQSLKAR